MKCINLAIFVITFLLLPILGLVSADDYTETADDCEYNCDLSCGVMPPMNSPLPDFFEDVQRGAISHAECTQKCIAYYECSAKPITPKKPTNEIFIKSRTDYILSDLPPYEDKPGILILLSTWQIEDGKEALVPYKDIYITISEEGKGVYREKQVTTGDNGQVFFKWTFKENQDDKNANEYDKSWVVNLSPDSSDPYAPGSALTTVSSWIPEDTYSFTKESVIANVYCGNRVENANGKTYRYCESA